MRLSRRFIITGILSVINTMSFALPFTIVPLEGVPFPTQVTKGQTVTAFYTVTNNTATVRKRNYVKYLPQHVVQSTTPKPGINNLCGSKFTLNPAGTSGSSCVLKLTVSGAVNPSTPNPHKHLFVCFPGGLSCAGTKVPLNISLNQPMLARTAYIPNFFTNEILLCQINHRGQFTECENAVSDSSTFNTPAQLALNPSAPLAYVTDFNNASGTIVSLCHVNASNGTLSRCGSAALDSSAVFNGPLGMTVNHTGTVAYVANINGGFVLSCTINPINGKFSDCVQQTGAPLFGQPIGVILNATDTKAYISTTGTTLSNGAVFICNVDSDTGSLNACENADEDGSAVFSGPALMNIGVSGSRFYVSDNGLGTGTSVSFCEINLFTGKLFHCQDSGVGPIFASPVSVSLNATNTKMYVSNNAGNTVSICTVNTKTGLLTRCSTVDGFAAPAGVTLR